jgi:hypothetical protein
MSPLTEIRQIEAFSLGILKGTLAQLNQARDSLMQAAEFRSKGRSKADIDPDALKGT